MSDERFRDKPQLVGQAEDPLVFLLCIWTFFFAWQVLFDRWKVDCQPEIRVSVFVPWVISKPFALLNGWCLLVMVGDVNLCLFLTLVPWLVVQGHVYVFLLSAQCGGWWLVLHGGCSAKAVQGGNTRLSLHEAQANINAEDED